MERHDLTKLRFIPMDNWMVSGVELLQLVGGDYYKGWSSPSQAKLSMSTQIYTSHLCLLSLNHCLHNVHAATMRSCHIFNNYF